MIIWLLVFFGCYVALWFVSVPTALAVTLVWAWLKMQDL